MSTRSSVIVVGGGVLGLAAGAELAAGGHPVTVIDAGGVNASRIAAGMIAPAMECLLDPVARPHAALLRRARDVWPAFAARHGLSLQPATTQWISPDAADRAAQLQALGFVAEASGEGLTTHEDWRIEAGPALDRLCGGLTRIKDLATSVAHVDGRWTVGLASGRAVDGDVLVVATGVEPALPGLPPAVAARLAAITPVRGQIARLVQAGDGPVRRAPGVYVAPGAGGDRLGATMETGRRDLKPEPEALVPLITMAEAAFGALPEIARIDVGVRGASPDGLPMVGASGTPGLFLAVAPRRNGWLLAPLAAAILAAAVEGRPLPADAAALDPARF
ncbi:MAG: FAD-dependent oxidoreductase [Brevundimonas sp.]|nr:FAD-dependent oxidoreductase [Brevundimonas sp.]